jgi:hypothetical protein
MKFSDSSVASPGKREPVETAPAVGASALQEAQQVEEPALT